MNTKRAEDRQRVPGLLTRGLVAILFVGGVVGMISLDEYSAVPTTTLLDVWIVAFIGAAFLRGKTGKLWPIMLLVGYLATRLVPGYLDGDPAFDLLQAYRWVVYLIAFYVAVGRTWGPTKNLRVLTFGLVGLALAKAAVTFVLIGPGERPGLLIENNFEIALFCGLIVVLYRDLSVTQRTAGVAMLGALMVLSGSRSGAVAFAVLVVFAIFQLRTTKATRAFVGLYALPIVAAVPYLVFAARQADSGGARIDRLNFLDVFISETRDWNIVNWLVGTEPITPLSPLGCGQLAYYENLFASSGDGSCYSVIMHAFVLRAIFDSGLLGLLLAFGGTWLALRTAKVSTSVSLAVLAIAGANSLSVSGLNNPYVALPIIAAILTADAAARGNISESEVQAQLRDVSSAHA